MNTQEALRAYAPEFVALDAAETCAYTQKGTIGSWEEDTRLDIAFQVEALKQTRPLLDAHAQALVKLAEVGKDAEIIQQCAERLQINIKAQEARIKELEEKLEKATQALKWYAEEKVSIEHGDYAHAALAEIGGE